LKQEGLTLAELRRNFERSMLVQQVQRVDVMDKVGVTDEEARAYYAENSREFTTPAEITLREILIEVPTTDRGFNAAADDEAKAKAEELRKRLIAGEPFARLAGEFSNAGSRANGGLIGPLKSDDLAPQLAQLLLKMKVGELTDVQRTQRGYQILKLESRTEQKVRSFEDARGDISDKVAERKFQAARDAYLDRLRAQATITWRNAELKRAYEQALLKRGGATEATAAPQAGQPNTEQSTR
jgi:parvulin-like peptidyl-prolyl isomerase